MSYPFPFTAILLVVSALLTCVASVIAWRHAAPGARALSLLLFAMSIWSGSYSIQWLPLPITIKLFSPHLTYIGVTTVPTLFLIFALRFTKHAGWQTRRALTALSLEPVVTLLLVWTNSYHHWIFRSINVLNQNGATPIFMEQGPWYGINLLYSYAVIVAGFVVLLYGMLRSGPLYRNQYLTILLAASIPWAFNMYSEYVLRTNYFDFTPAMFGLAAILFTYSIVCNGFMNIIPVARSQIIESMSDGVLVLDAQNRIVDINPAMERFLDCKPATLLGKPAAEALDGWMKQNESLASEREMRTELRIQDSPSRYLDLRVTPLHDTYGRMTGRLMVFRDVTDRKRVEKQLRYANERLQSQLIEIGMLQSKLRSQAIRDPLTDLFNRRYLDETLDRELARASREDYPVCVIMMDIDHFKKMNDTYGHEAGDVVLKMLAKTLSARNRKGDFTCRFGGEEFVVVMPNIELETAYRRAEDLRRTLNSMLVEYGQHKLAITISMGIASYPSNGMDRESVLRAADHAMYAAKKAGRDHILTYDRVETRQQAFTD